MAQCFVIEQNGFTLSITESEVTNALLKQGGLVTEESVAMYLKQKMDEYIQSKTPVVVNTRQLFDKSLVPINIYSTDKNGFENLSNLLNGPVKAVIDGKELVFKTVEHLFQAKKALFAKDKEAANNIFTASNGFEAQRLGRTVKNLNTKEWDKVSSSVLKDAMKAAFEQNPQSLNLLLSTNQAPLTHKAEANLGKWEKEFPQILMEIRQELGNTSEAETNSRTLQSYSGFNEVTSYSGAADGADKRWEQEGKQRGLKHVNYVVDTLSKLTPEQQREVEAAYQQAVKDLGRRPLPYDWQNPNAVGADGKKLYYSGGLVRRDYLQAKAGDAVFGIIEGFDIKQDTSKPDNRTNPDKSVKSYKFLPKGGTGYAVVMAARMNKPIYLFDQSTSKWYDYNQGLPIEIETPILTKKFTGVGTRKLQQNGIDAIKAVFDKTAEFIKSNSRRQESVLNNFQGYKGGFENTGKGTKEGDGKDKAMREVADGFVGESVRVKELNKNSSYGMLSSSYKTESSTDTSYKSISEKSGSAIEIFDNEPTLAVIGDVVMLARNSEFNNKPLHNSTKKLIKSMFDSKAEFVVGDMPGVDSQFIEYLQEIGAKFTIYHTGNSSRIQVAENKNSREIKNIPVVISDEKYTRNSVEEDSNTMYLFTDNAERTSSPNSKTENVNKDSWYYKKYKNQTNKPVHFGTTSNPTSAVIRGLNNAYPISTMSAYGTNWTSDNFDLFKTTINDEIEQIKNDMSKFNSLKIGDFRIGQGGLKATLPAEHQAYLDTKLLELGIDNTGEKPKLVTVQNSREQQSDTLESKQIPEGLKEDTPQQEVDKALEDLTCL